MVAYRCDRCGKIFDWYEIFYHDKRFNHMDFNQMEKWKKENPNAPFWESPDAVYRANAIKLMFYEPVNENCSTNNGRLTGEIQETDEGNNPLIMLCADCMTDFTKSLKEWWDYR